jgi:hypothetical protein
MYQRTCASALLILSLALLAPDTATAQEDRRFEAFGSFSYLIADVGGSEFGLADVNGAGFTGEFAFFLNDWLGLGVEGGYNSGDLDLPVIAIFPPPDISFSQWTLVFGPRFRFAQTERFRVGAQAMAGIAQGRVHAEFDPEELIVGLPDRDRRRLRLRAFDVAFDQTVFALSFGVHFDLKISDRLTWRVAQPDLLVTGYGDEAQKHFRISSGLGFEF